MWVSHFVWSTSRWCSNVWPCDPDEWYRAGLWAGLDWTLSIRIWPWGPAPSPSAGIGSWDPAPPLTCPHGTPCWDWALGLHTSLAWYHVPGLGPVLPLLSPMHWDWALGTCTTLSQFCMAGPGPVLLYAPGFFLWLMHMDMLYGTYETTVMVYCSRQKQMKMVNWSQQAFDCAQQMLIQ